MTRWIRNRPERRHDVAAGLAAGVAGVVVGAGVFWLVRVLAAREVLPGGSGGASADDGAPLEGRSARRALGPPPPGGGGVPRPGGD